MSEIADLALAVNRLAQVLEQGVLEYIDKPEKAIVPPLLADEPPPPQEPPVEEFPPFEANVAANVPKGTCPTHRAPWKYVPPGVSKSSGKPYEGFWACPERGCRERPR